MTHCLSVCWLGVLRGASKLSALFDFTTYYLSCPIKFISRLTNGFYPMIFLPKESNTFLDCLAIDSYSLNSPQYTATKMLQ